MPNKKYIYVGLAAIVLLYVVWVLFRIFVPQQEIVSEQTDEQVIEVLPVNEEPEDVSSHGQDQTQDAATEGNVSADSLKSETEDQIVVNEGNYVENEEPVAPQSRIKLKVKGDSWIELKDAEKVYISGIYHKGFEYDAPNVEGLILSIGKYYNVDVYIDDQLTKVAGPKRQTRIRLDNFLKH